MSSLVARQLRGVKVIHLPFVTANLVSRFAQIEITKRRFDFIYVASGEPHKNHKSLIAAWSLLADQGVFPSLALTLSPKTAPELCALVAQETVSRGLRICNLGVMSHKSLLTVYRESGALIYPSSFESFGLPLIEARNAGLSVLAPELDYVRDVINPDQTFDEGSPLSIARAVRRHLEGPGPCSKLYTAETLLELLLKGDLA